MITRTMTHKDLARLLSVSETTIKSYRRKFGDCIPVANQGKPIRFTGDAATVCRRIRDYFAKGMSVEEVRTRLADEFSWINLLPQQKDEPAAAPLSLPPEFTMGVSNLAKSMVTLTQQQGSMLKRMQELEKTFDQMRQASPGNTTPSLPGAPCAPSAPGSDGASGDAGTTADISLESIHHALAPLHNLQQLDKLAYLDEVHSLVTALHQATTALAEAAGVLQRVAGESAQSGRVAENDAAEAGRVLQFPGTAAGRSAPPQAEYMPNDNPPRHLLTLPLVVRTAQGSYMGAGGRSRGRFTINDLKAMLAYGRTPPDHYVMRWHNDAEGWWLIFEQPQAEAPRSLQLLLGELATQRGMSVAEVTRFIDNGRSAHPAELCGFVADVAGE